MISTIMAPCWEAAGAALPDAAPVAAEAALPAAHPVAAAAPAQPVAGPTGLAAATGGWRGPGGGGGPGAAAGAPAPGYGGGRGREPVRPTRPLAYRAPGTPTR